MSKTKGNGAGPLDTVEKFGVDALRYWVSTSPIGGDLRYSDDEVKRGSKLLTKLWNAGLFRKCHGSVHGLNKNRRNRYRSYFG